MSKGMSELLMQKSDLVMESAWLDTNVTALHAYPLNAILHPNIINKNFSQKASSKDIVLFAGIGSKLEVYLISSNVSRFQFHGPM